MNPIQQAIEVLAKITDRDRHRGLVQLDVEDFLEIGAALTSLRSLQKEVEEVLPGPVHYQYLFAGYGGDVWRDSDKSWNGQRPKAHRSLYTADQLRTAVAAALGRGAVPHEYLAKFIGKGNGMVRRFYNGEAQSVNDAGDWMQEAMQLLQLKAAAPSPEATQPTQAEAPSERYECVGYIHRSYGDKIFALDAPDREAVYVRRTALATQQAEPPEERRARLQAACTKVFATQQAVQPITKEWCLNMARKEIESDADFSAGVAQQAVQGEPANGWRDTVRAALHLLNDTQNTLGRFLANHRNPSEKDTVSTLLGLHDTNAALRTRRELSDLLATPPAPGQVAVLRSDVAGGPIQRYRLYEGGYMEPYIGGDWVTYADVCATFSDPGQVERDREDAERWRAFIGLEYKVRMEWACNLSLVPVLIEWVDQLRAARSSEGGGNEHSR